MSYIVVHTVDRDICHVAPYSTLEKATLHAKSIVEDEMFVMGDEWLYIYEAGDDGEGSEVDLLPYDTIDAWSRNYRHEHKLND
jgi:hypothetical protein